MTMNRFLRISAKHLYNNKLDKWSDYKLLINRYISSSDTKIDYDNNTLEILNKSYTIDDYTNIPYYMNQYIGQNLYLKPGNPIYLITEGIKHSFPECQVFHYENPVVDIESNFDSLLISEDHISRKPSQTYYVNKDYVLRTHTSAHQTQCLRANAKSFLCIADVYRRDDIDNRHHCVFHQCEILKIYDIHNEEVVIIFVLYKVLTCINYVFCFSQ
jgi:phenylalanyl-tRNA synthetase alpha chain